MSDSLTAGGGTSGALMRFERMTATAIGAGVGILGVAVMAGWVLRSQPLVQLLPAGSAMTISTALGFLLGGSMLMLLVLRRARAVALVLGAALVALSWVSLVQHAVGFDTGIDLRRWHEWLADGNPSPGRSSVSTGTAFLVFAVSALALELHSGRAVRNFAALGGWLVLALGAVNFAGYALRLEDLFPALQGYRMALHTSAAAMALGAGLLLLRGASYPEAPASEQRAGQITAAALGVLVLATLIAGGTVFALMQQRLQEAVGQDLYNAFEVRRQLVVSAVQAREGTVELIAAQPTLRRALRAAKDRPATAPDPAALEAVRSFIGSDFSAVVVLDAHGRELTRSGRFAEADERSTRLASALQSDLLWAGRLILRTRLMVRDSGEELGTVVAEQRVRFVEELMIGKSGLGETGEMGLCFASGARLLCYPLRLNPQAFETARESRSGQPFPMSLALEGGTGVVRTRDYRGRNVIAAYGPVGGLGLGMVVKMDTAELLAPVRAQLPYVLLAVALAVLAGVALLRSRVQPLAARLDAAMRRVEQLANYDSLTGTANRHLFGDRLEQALARSRRTGGSGALLYLDLDGFKRVNDQFGHAAGDALLKEFAARLRAGVRAVDTVGRQGGDEFAVLLEGLGDAGAARRVAEKIIEAVRAPVSAGGHQFTVTTSIGIAIFDRDAREDAERLAKRADEALYAAKAAGRNTFRIAA